MQISKRLEAVAGMVTSGSFLADIGTDHGYIPIYLIEHKRIPKAIAMDVNRGPLEKAKEHIMQAGLQDKIETRLSDGLEKLKPDEAESILIAGMGGPLTVRILSEGAGKLGACRELILQPQSDLKAVRAYLEREGWKIVREEMVQEEGKFYPMMRAVPGEECKMTPIQLRFGPLLLANCHPVLKDYLLREQRINEKILTSLEGQKSETAKARISEVEAELAMVREALEVFGF